MPEAKLLTDAQTLSYLHSTISTNSQPITVPQVPSYIDALIGDCDLAGGLSPRLGEQTLHVLTIKGFPAEPLYYLSVKLDCPTLDKPISAALFDRDGGADLVWSRQK